MLPRKASSRESTNTSLACLLETIPPTALFDLAYKECLYYGSWFGTTVRDGEEAVEARGAPAVTAGV